MEKEEGAIGYLNSLADKRREMVPVVSKFRERLVNALEKLPEFTEAVTKSFFEDSETSGGKRVGFGLDQYWYEINISKKGEELSVFRCGLGEEERVGALLSGFSLNNTGKIFYLEVIGGEWDPRKKEWDEEAVPFVESIIGELEIGV